MPSPDTIPSNSTNHVAVLQLPTMRLNQEQPERRMRFGTTKVKTGCSTCKIRRVKCDEGKPTCRRCSSSGRACDEYKTNMDAGSKNIAPRNVDHAKLAGRFSNREEGQSLKHHHRNLVIIDQQSDSSQMLVRNPFRSRSDQMESRSMDYFIRRTVPQLSDLSDSKFWCETVLRMIQYDQSVRLCAIAVSSMYEHRFEKTQALQLEIAAEPSHALRQYNKAIASLMSQVTCGKAPLEVVLICCILFVCLEFLRG